MDLRGRAALVTGGAVRVGRAISLGLAKAGMKVVLHYRASEEEAEAAAAEIRAGGGEVVLARADLAEVEEVRRLAREAEAAFGAVDVLVNNASVFPAQGLLDADEAVWSHTLAVNLTAPFLLTRELGARMKERGAGLIVNLADLAGIQVWNGYAAHSISKAGLVHLTRVAARALAPEVRVVAIAPGTVLPPDGMALEEIEKLAERTALRRIGSPDDVVEALLYLARADFVTGELLVLDGGRMLK
jgi:pteridine reductase